MGVTAAIVGPAPCATGSIVMPVSQETFGRAGMFVRKFSARILGIGIVLGLIYGSFDLQPIDKSLRSDLLAPFNTDCAGKPVNIDVVQRMASDTNPFTGTNDSHWENSSYFRRGRSGWWRLELGITEDKIWRFYLMRSYCIISATGPGRIEELR